MARRVRGGNRARRGGLPGLRRGRVRDGRPRVVRGVPGEHEHAGRGRRLRRRAAAGGAPAHQRRLRVRRWPLLRGAGGAGHGLLALPRGQVPARPRARGVRGLRGGAGRAGRGVARCPRRPGAVKRH